MTTDKKELAVAALRNGTVIDHIPADVLFKTVEILGIASLDKSVTIGFNLASRRLGRKGIIKVADTEFPRQQLDRIAILAPTAVVNTIRDYEVAEKKQVQLPDEIVDLCVCGNPKCATRHEPMPSRFTVVSREPVVLKCHYCEHEMSGGNIQLK